MPASPAPAPPPRRPAPRPDGDAARRYVRPRGAPRSPTRLLAWSLAVGGVLSGAGCAPSGDDPRNQRTAWRAPSGEYVVYYLEPPWELGTTTSEGVELRIASNATTFGGLDGGPGKYELSVAAQAGTPAARVAADRRAAASSGDDVLVEPREIVTEQGVVGQELLTVGPGAAGELFGRVAYLPLDAGRVLRLGFVATPPLDTQEVTAMIRLVEIPGAP